MTVAVPAPVKQEAVTFRPYECKIEFTQSSKGVVQFSGYIHFDGTGRENIKEHILKLGFALNEAERTFGNLGYKVASENSEVVVNNKK